MKMTELAVNGNVCAGNLEKTVKTPPEKRWKMTGQKRWKMTT